MGLLRFIKSSIAEEVANFAKKKTKEMAPIRKGLSTVEGCTSGNHNPPPVKKKKCCLRQGWVGLGSGDRAGTVPTARCAMYYPLMSYRPPPPAMVSGVVSAPPPGNGVRWRFRLGLGL